MRWLRATDYGAEPSEALLQQAYVKGEGEDVAAHVAAVAKEVGAPITVKSYVRFEKGEGIEKREDDLAAEVAKMVNG